MDLTANESSLKFTNHNTNIKGLQQAYLKKTQISNQTERSRNKSRLYSKTVLADSPGGTTQQQGSSVCCVYKSPKTLGMQNEMLPLL